MILKQGHKYLPMPHDGKVIRRIYRGGRCYYIASPYSPEATQALKAAFPQYWTAIRDYGWANPALVPFINEDPMLIVSLVEVGKERWLVGDGKAYIITDLIPLKSDVINIRVMSTTNTSQGASIFGRYPNLYLQNWRNAINCNGTGSVATSEGNIYDIELNSTYYSVNGKQTNYSRSDCTDVCGLFGFYYNGWTQFWIGAINNVHMNESNLVPFNGADRIGMLDLNTFQFYPNANTEGAFTIQLTDKA